MSSAPPAGIHPTRMELLALKRRRVMAERGMELLREKLEALMIEVFEFVREFKALRDKAQDLLAKAYRDFGEAEMILGFSRLAQVAVGVGDRYTVETATRTIMGIPIPYVRAKVREFVDPPYNLYDTSAKLDEAVMKMSEAVKVIAELSSTGAALRKLLEAIASTRRRVNALEYVIIPRLNNAIRYIEMYLQEREREDFFRLKRIKKRLAVEEARHVREAALSQRPSRGLR